MTRHHYIEALQNVKKEEPQRTKTSAAACSTPKGTQTLRASFVGKMAINPLMISLYNVHELHEKVMYMADSKALRGKSLWFRSRKGIKNNLYFCEVSIYSEIRQTI